MPQYFTLNGSAAPLAKAKLSAALPPVRFSTPVNVVATPLTVPWFSPVIVQTVVAFGPVSRSLPAWPLTTRLLVASVAWTLTASAPDPVFRVTT